MVTIAERRSADPLAYGVTSRTFTNEVGNKIEIYVALGAAPDKLCRLTMTGPNSTTDNYTTRMELEQLRDALNDVFSHV